MTEILIVPAMVFVAIILGMAWGSYIQRKRTRKILGDIVDRWYREYIAAGKAPDKRVEDILHKLVNEIS